MTLRRMFRAPRVNVSSVVGGWTVMSLVLAMARLMAMILDGSHRVFRGVAHNFAMMEVVK